MGGPGDGRTREKTGRDCFELFPELSSGEIMVDNNQDAGCPLCNSLISLHQVCPQCNQALLDGGRVEDFLGPYAPYEELDTDWEPCTHLIYCPACGQDWRVAI